MYDIFLQNKEYVYEGKKYIISAIIDDLILIHSNEIFNFFHKNKIKFSSNNKNEAIRTLLQSKIKRIIYLNEIENRELVYRYMWFDYFCNFQLKESLYLLKTRQDFIEYKHAVLKSMLIELLIENDKTIILKLIKFTVDKIKKQSLGSDTLISFNKNINKLFFDKTNTIEGVHPDTFRIGLYNAGTREQINNIAINFQIKIIENIRTKKSKIELFMFYSKVTGISIYSETDLKGFSDKKLYNILSNARLIDKNTNNVSKIHLIEQILYKFEQTRKNYSYQNKISIYNRTIKSNNSEESNLIELKFNQEKIKKDIEQLTQTIKFEKDSEKIKTMKNRLSEIKRVSIIVENEILKLSNSRNELELDMQNKINKLFKLQEELRVLNNQKENNLLRTKDLEKTKQELLKKHFYRKEKLKFNISLVGIFLFVLILILLAIIRYLGR